MPIGGHGLPIFFTTCPLTHTNTGLTVFSGELKTHAVKYSETAGTQSVATVGIKKHRQDDLQQGQTLSECL